MVGDPGGEILSVSSVRVRKEVGVDGVVGAKTVWGGGLTKRERTKATPD